MKPQVNRSETIQIQASENDNFKCTAQWMKVCSRDTIKMRKKMTPTLHCVFSIGRKASKLFVWKITHNFAVAEINRKQSYEPFGVNLLAINLTLTIERRTNDEWYCQFVAKEAKIFKVFDLHEFLFLLPLVSACLCFPFCV